ncbi:MAG: hypothetical protein ABEH65_09065 [Halobacteriales archaeon]
MTVAGDGNEWSVTGNQGSEIAIEPRDDTDGLLLIDPIDRRRYRLETDQTVEPRAVPTDRFRFPVDTAVEITTKTITIADVPPVNVRDITGAVVTKIEHSRAEQLPSAAYSIELSAPIKLYLDVTAGMTIDADPHQLSIEFDGTTTVAIGARSHHKHPAGTVTTTTDPADMMAAVSTFGSALKTHSPERSFPTLRGHPPLVDIGEERSIPAGLTPPETGIEIGVPRRYATVFAAAPLAYYLGATVVPSETATLRTDSGFTHSLETERGIEGEIERVLKQTFFLDCVTRTEGLYPVDLHERAAIESTVGLDFQALYDQPIAAQLEAYLDVPFEQLREHLTDWKLTSHVQPTADSIEMLPFVVKDLAVVKTPTGQTVTPSALEATAIDAFFRDELTRGTTAAATDDEQRTLIEPESTDSIEQTWIGEETPVGASKATREAYLNRLTRSPTTDEITITVVCNETAMSEEQEVVDIIYGSREYYPFEVTIEQDQTTAELATILESDIDFLHYIGHSDAAGFRCRDGTLSPTSLDTVGADAFLLNACRSYDQGEQLIEAGSIGGVVTLSDIINSGAIRVGRAMARLLNRGFPIRAALDIASDQSLIGYQYLVIGDGSLTIAQAESGTPYLCELGLTDGTTSEEFSVEIQTYPTSERGIGSMFIPYLQENETYFLSSGRLETFTLTAEELRSFLNREEIPVRIDDELAWSREIDPATIRDRL